MKRSTTIHEIHPSRFTLSCRVASRGVVPPVPPWFRPSTVTHPTLTHGNACLAVAGAFLFACWGCVKRHKGAVVVPTAPLSLCPPPGSAVKRFVDIFFIFNILFQILSYICRSKQSNTNNMKDYVTNSFSERGGGYAPVGADIVECRVKMFYRRKSPLPISQIPIDDRRIAVFVMINSFVFSTATLAEFFKVSQRTIQRDYDNEIFFQSRNKVHQAAATALRDYIIYNAKYCS